MATQKENNLIIGTNIKRLLKEHNKTRKDICQVLGFNYATFSDWLQGRSYPRPDKVDKLANYFNVPRSALVDPPATSNTTVTGDNNSTATTGTISNSTINGTINTGTINGNIITPSTTENDTCQMYHALSAEARGQIDNLVKMLHDMENKK